MKALFVIASVLVFSLMLSCGNDSESPTGPTGPTGPTVSKPTASFSMSCGTLCYDLTSSGTNRYTAEAPVTIYTTNSSTDADTYLWDFGDGFTTTNTNPSRTYTNPGSYTIRLAATNTAGSNTVEKYLTVEEPPHWILEDSSSFSLSAGYVSWYGPTTYNSYADSSVGKKYVVSASSAVDVYIVPNHDEYEHYVANESFNHYPSMQAEGVTTYSEEGNISVYSGIMISNENLFSSITITRKVYRWSEGKLESTWPF